MTQTKRLFVVRHGEIEAPDSLRFADGDRPLSDSGAEKIALLAKMLAKLKISPERILHSPLLRATQTAEILGTQLNVKLTSWDVLANDISADRWPGELTKQFINCDQLMMVGHEPSLVCLIAALTGSSPYSFDLRRGALAELNISNSINYKKARLVALVSPDWVPEVKA